MTKATAAPLKISPQLKRYPLRKRELLQAWDSADELILEHLSETDLSGKRLLVVNDSFGALSCALGDQDLTTYTDSYLSAQGIRLNSQNKIQPVSELGALSGIYDRVLIRVPKNMSFFEDILCHLSKHLGPQSQIICGYMVKHQAKAAFDLLNKIIGETTTSLAKKKARLIFAQFKRGPTASPYPHQIAIEPFKFPFTNHSGVFSREKLDIGTRFLLENIPQGAFKTILDLGCANGVIGIAAKRTNPSAKLIFSDESMMAVQSATANYTKFFRDPAQFLWTHCYQDQTADSVDLVLCNPPFHQGHTGNLVDDFVAQQMFRDAHHALVKGGKIRVIGNSHLHYEDTLKKIFGYSEIVAKHPKFIILDAVK